MKLCTLQTRVTKENTATRSQSLPKAKEINRKNVPQLIFLIPPPFEVRKTQGMTNAYFSNLPTKKMLLKNEIK